MTRHANAKAQCKHAKKYGTQIVCFLRSLKQTLDKEHELSHAYVDKSSLTYTDLTEQERNLKHRKRRAR